MHRSGPHADHNSKARSSDYRAGLQLRSRALYIAVPSQQITYTSQSQPDVNLSLLNHYNSPGPQILQNNPIYPDRVPITIQVPPGTSATAKSLAGDVGRGGSARSALRTAKSVVKDFGAAACSALQNLSRASEKKSDSLLGCAVVFKSLCTGAGEGGFCMILSPLLLRKRPSNVSSSI